MDISAKILGKLDFGILKFQQLTQQLSAIDTFKGNWKSVENKKGRYLKELRKIATVESIGSSTRIEGATITDKEVEKLLKSIKITRLTTRDEQEVVGYYDSLQTILEHYEGIDITERYIHQLHGMLLKHSDKDQFHKGRYKTLSNQVVANYPDGSKKIIFKTAEPHLVEPEMQELIQWVNDRITINDMHPLMVAGVFVYEFLSIHPYQDGNGRLSRLLTTLILLKFGYEFVQYVSFEHIVETKKETYYRALMDGQKNRYKKDERIDLWMFFFLECLNTLVKRLEEKYNTLNKLSLGINERQQKIIAFIKKNKSAQLSDVESALEIYSKNTLKKDLSKLLDEGLLIRTGAGRSVRYHFKS